MITKNIYNLKDDSYGFKIYVDGIEMIDQQVAPNTLLPMDKGDAELISESMARDIEASILNRNDEPEQPKTPTVEERLEALEFAMLDLLA